MKRTRLIKIGFATDVDNRVAALQTATPFDIELEEWFTASRESERRLHRLLKRHQYRREWYRGWETVNAVIEEIDRGRIEQWAATPGAKIENLGDIGDIDCSDIIAKVCAMGIHAFE